VDDRGCSRLAVTVIIVWLLLTGYGITDAGRAASQSVEAVKRSGLSSSLDYCGRRDPTGHVLDISPFEKTVLTVLADERHCSWPQGQPSVTGGGRCRWLAGHHDRWPSKEGSP